MRRPFAIVSAVFMAMAADQTPRRDTTPHFTVERPRQAARTAPTKRAASSARTVPAAAASPHR